MRRAFSVLMAGRPQDTRRAAQEVVDARWVAALDAVTTVGCTRKADVHGRAVAALALLDSAVDAYEAAVTAYWSEQPSEVVGAARRLVPDATPIRDHFLSAIRRDGVHPDGDDYDVRLCRSRSRALANLLDSLVTYGYDEKARHGLLTILRKMATMD